MTTKILGAFTRPPRFLQIKQAIAGPMYAYNPGQFLELATGHTTWPEPFLALLEPTDDGTLRAVAVESLPAHMDRTVIDPATFRTTEPPAPTPPALITAADIERLIHLREADLDAAQALGFPKPCAQRSTQTGTGWDACEVTPLWREDHVLAWAAQQATIRGVIGGARG